MKLWLITVSIFLCCFSHSSACSVIYKCEIDGVTSYSQEPCDISNHSKGVYQPTEPSMAYKSTIAPLPETDEEAPVNTMDAGDAIVVRGGSCNRDSYSGVIENISNYSTYRATINVVFKYFKGGMGKKKWDSKKKTFTLKPGKVIQFDIKGRSAPSSYSIECEVTRSIQFTDSTVTR